MYLLSSRLLLDMRKWPESLSVAKERKIQFDRDIRTGRGGLLE